MPRYQPFQVKRVEGKGLKKWQLSIPASASETGKFRRLYFKTKEKAEAQRDKRRADIQKFGRQAHEIDPALASEAVEIAATLVPFGATLRDAAREFVAAREAEAASRPFSEFFEEILGEKEATKSANYGVNFRKSCQRLIPYFGSTPIASISAEDLRGALEKEAGTSAALFNALRSHASVVWSAALKRGWAPKNIVAAIDKFAATPSPIRTLTVTELRHLLSSAEEVQPDCAVPFALQAFTGIRTEELRRTSWECIDWEEGEMALDEAITKTNRYRVVTLQPNLLAWLACHAPTRRTGSLVPPDWRRKATRVRNRAGWAVVDLLETDPKKAQPKNGAPPWPVNGLRKSFGSAHLKAFGNLDITITEMGHHGDPRTFWRFYHRGYSKKEALAYWRSGPEGTETKLTAAA